MFEHCGCGTMMDAVAWVSCEPEGSGELKLFKHKKISF